MDVRVNRCRSCNAEIRWAKTAAGKRIPLDVDPVRTGNVQLGLVGGEEIAIVVGAADAVAAQAAGLELYLSHFATCPNAASHRHSAGTTAEPEERRSAPTVSASRRAETSEASSSPWPSSSASQYREPLPATTTAPASRKPAA